MSRKPKAPVADWRSIEDDREKYAAYLCSREWNVKKEAVHKRAGECCERCNLFSINAVHHLTYERKYDEPLEDLQGTCRLCHEFTHGKSDFDPCRHRRLLLYFAKCKQSGRPPYPFQLHGGLIAGRAGLRLTMAAIDQLNVLLDLANYYDQEMDGYEAIAEAVKLLDSRLPFDYREYKLTEAYVSSLEMYDRCASLLGVQQLADKDLCGPCEDEDSE